MGVELVVGVGAPALLPPLQHHLKNSAIEAEHIETINNSGANIGSLDHNKGIPHGPDDHWYDNLVHDLKPENIVDQDRTVMLTRAYTC